MGAVGDTAQERYWRWNGVACVYFLANDGQEALTGL
jgi:hypothetical protein